MLMMPEGLCHDLGVNARVGEDASSLRAFVCALERGREWWWVAGVAVRHLCSP